MRLGEYPLMRRIGRAETPGMVRLDADILMIACDASRERALRYAEPLWAAMRKHSVDTPLRAAHFLAQISHESGRLRYAEEVWGPTAQQKRYDPASGSTLARKLGNERAGDGFRYRGRGLIQLTGLGNYRLYMQESGVLVVRYPDILREPHWAADVAAWYFKRWGCLEAADADDVRTVTRKINGGYNGLSDRLRLLVRAKTVLLGLNHLGLSHEIAPMRPKGVEWL